jgi:hypothetical protein
LPVILTQTKLRLDDPFNYDAWADESFALAQSVAYKGMKNGGMPSASYNNKALKVAAKESHGEDIDWLPS